MKNKNYTCPVCGYPSLDEAPYDKHGCASYEICPCCGSEFGYDDFTTTHAELRQRWIANGMTWWSSARNQPPEWNAERQLLNIKSDENALGSSDHADNKNNARNKEG